MVPCCCSTLVENRTISIWGMWPHRKRNPYQIDIRCVAEPLHGAHKWLKATGRGKNQCMRKFPWGARLWIAALEIELGTGFQAC